MREIKPFRSYDEQVQLLVSRGMEVEDTTSAAQQLARLNYYRLSGYWHSMRCIDPESSKSLDTFRPGASFKLTVQLYNFDARLRHAAFVGLERIELAIRTLIGHHLGAINPIIHLNPALLGPIATQRARGKPETYHELWLKKYHMALSNSREEFVEHHLDQYEGVLPTWVAVEIMDWGMLSHLYRIAPVSARDAIADTCNLRSPQLESWLKCLNILRNYCAHHARVFNRVFAIQPRLPQDQQAEILFPNVNRAFGQFSLIQYLLHELQLDGTELLPAALETFPHNDLIPFHRIGAPGSWRGNPLWKMPQTP